MPRRSATTPDSTELNPAALCPPARIASGSPSAAANRTVAATSAESAQRTTAAGRLSRERLSMARATSYPG